MLVVVIFFFAWWLGYIGWMAATVLSGVVLSLPWTIPLLRRLYIEARAPRTREVWLGEVKLGNDPIDKYLAPMHTVEGARVRMRKDLSDQYGSEMWKDICEKPGFTDRDLCRWWSGSTQGRQFTLEGLAKDVD